MSLTFRYKDKYQMKKSREEILVEETGYPSVLFTENIRKYGNGLMNAKGGIIFFGIKKGEILGDVIGRRLEDSFRLALDRTMGSCVPFVPPSSYRIIFHEVQGHPRYKDNLKVIEVKISAGQVGQIYEDGSMQMYLVHKGELLGPLWPQEIKELSIIKYKESLDQMKSLCDFKTPAVKPKPSSSRIERTEPSKENTVNKKQSEVAECSEKGSKQRTGDRGQEEIRLEKGKSRDKEEDKDKPKTDSKFINFKSFKIKRPWSRDGRG